MAFNLKNRQPAPPEEDEGIGNLPWDDIPEDTEIDNSPGQGEEDESCPDDNLPMHPNHNRRLCHIPKSHHYDPIRYSNLESIELIRLFPTSNHRNPRNHFYTRKHHTTHPNLFCL